MEGFSEHAWRLIHALAKCEFAVADEILRSAPGILAERNGVGETPLHWLTVENHLEAVRFLLGRGALVDTGDMSDSTPLIHAAGLGYTEMVRLLLMHGARLDCCSTTSGTPLRAAASAADDPTVIDLLVEYGANVNEPDELGSTPLHAAVSRGNAATVRRLLALGANPRARTVTGETPLHSVGLVSVSTADRSSSSEDLSSTGISSAEKAEVLADLASKPPPSSREVIKALIEFGADPNALDDLKLSALHHAAFHGDLDSIRCLLESGVKPDLLDEFGATAADCARAAGHYAAADLLRER